MPTRLYLLDSGVGTPPVSPAFGAWNDTAGAVRRWLSPERERGTAFETRSRAEAVATSPYDVLLAQFISSPLEAQTISGTVKGQIRASESATDADFRAQVLIKVVSGDGATLRGVLLDLDTGALASEFATSLTNRRFPRGGAVSLTSVAAQAGDRLVVEVGYRSHNAHTTSRTGSIEIGAAASTDLPEDETTATQLNPWIEFSGAITFQPLEHRWTAENVQVSAADPAPEHRWTAENVQVSAADPAPEHRWSSIVIQVSAEEYWYGWGIVLDSGDD